MKYNIGDVMVWKYDKEELSTVIKIWYDWDGTTMYILESWVKLPVGEYIKESYGEEELTKFIDRKILEHIPIKI